MDDAVSCKACGRPMRYVRMVATGRLNPLDADPSPGGNIRVDGGEGFVVSRSDREGGKYAHMPLFLSHFATCPEGPRFRRKP